MIYKFLIQIIKAALFFFFKKIVVTGKKHIPANGPLIIVANHPNTFMDPLLIAAITDQRIGFVANASIFLNQFITKIFTYFHVIPIFRKKDVEPGEKPDNRQAFSKCHEYLNQNGTLLIFPEGTSYYELKLREIKTGTARIALSFEELKGFQNNLKIVPIALDYSDSIQFRSVVAITVRPPISVHKYKLAYEKNEFDAVSLLTEDIRGELADLIPQTTDKEQEKFLLRAHQFYTSFYAPKVDLNLNPKQSLELRNQASKVLQFIQTEKPKLYHDTQDKLTRFCQLLKQEDVSSNVISESIEQNNGFLKYTAQVLKYIILFPVYLMGLISNYIPYIMTAKIFNAMKLDIEYKAPVQMITGFFTYPAYYALFIWIFRKFVSAELWHSILLFILMPIFGYVALYYYTQLKRFMNLLHFDFFIPRHKKQVIIRLKDEILKNMETARNYALEGFE